MMRNARQVLTAGVLTWMLTNLWAAPVRAQEVNGIYTEAATKDLGDVFKVDALKGIKFRGWLDAYYVWNANRPSIATANANQGASVVKSRDATIEGRTFDVHHNSFSLSLAEIEIEKVPDRGKVGFKFDLTFGDTQDIIVDTIRGGLIGQPSPVSDFDKVFQHASIGYVASVGKGLRMDFGKFVTHIGGETIESIKNRNYSRSFFYTYAIPFQDSGFRLNYPWNSKFYNEIYILNGWNVTSDNNSGKTFGLSAGWTPNSRLSVYANSLHGPERTGNNTDYRHLGDFQVIYYPSKTLQTMLNVDIAMDENAVGPGQDGFWSGYTAYLRKNIKDRFFPTLRVEYYKDKQGFTTGVPQELFGVTITGDIKLGKKDDFGHILLRPELRYDRSSAPFFSSRTGFRTRNHQLTAGVGMVYYF